MCLRRLNFSFGKALVHLVAPEPGLVSALMTREDQEVWDRLEAAVANEAYIDDLWWQHLELVEVERAIFAANGGKVIIISDDKDDGK